MEFLQVLEGTSCMIGNVELQQQIVNLLHTIITGIKIVVPILLIIWGMFDLGKAVIAQKEDEIKKGQQTFMKRAIAAVIVFFIPTIVDLIVQLVGSNDESSIKSCIEAIL